MPKAPKMPGDKITPPEVYFSRRAFIKGGMIAASLAVTATVYRRLSSVPTGTVEKPKLAGLTQVAPVNSSYPPDLAKAFRTDETQTSFQNITHYNNFYEFSTDKEGVADNVGDFSTAGWKITVDGLVAKPSVFDMDDIHKIAAPEERVYRMRCVETWSMVIPWAGVLVIQIIGTGRAAEQREVCGLPPRCWTPR